MNKDFDSPTTPGLKIDFPNYLIELVCLNCDKKLNSRFWKSNTYWSNKYKREIKGVHNLIKCFDAPIDENTKVNTLENSPFAQKILIAVVKRLNVKSLSAKKTIQKVVSNHKKTFEQEYGRRLLATNEEVINRERINDHNNARYSEDGSRNKLSTIRELEKGI